MTNHLTIWTIPKIGACFHALPEMYKTGNPCAKCPSNSVCSTKYQGLCEVRGDQVPLPVPSRPIVPIAPPNNNDIDIFRPSDATGT